MAVARMGISRIWIISVLVVFDCPCFSLNATLAQICWSLFFSSSSVCFWMTQAGDKRLSHIRLKELPAILFECGHF